MARNHYLYHIPNTKRPFHTLEAVAAHLGISVNTLRNQFRTGDDSVTVGDAEVTRTRIAAKDGGKAREWRRGKAEEYGSFAEYRRERKRIQDEDCD